MFDLGKKALGLRGVLAVGLLVGALLSVPPTAAAKKTRKPHCKHGYTLKWVKVAKRTKRGMLVRKHGRVVYVRVRRCEKRKSASNPTPTAPGSPTPTIHYQATVNASFTQAPANPLAVTYAYSADATETVGAQQVDLASQGQLPAGILNFYSQQTPGGPQVLFCSMNVGGATTGGHCPVTYSTFGVWHVTTQYVPTGTTAVTGTDAVAIWPFSTTTTLAVTPISCGANSTPSPDDVALACWTIAANIVENGTPVQADVMYSEPTYGWSGGALAGANCPLTLYSTPPPVTYHTWFQCEPGVQGWTMSSPPASFTFTAAFAGFVPTGILSPSNGWAPSTSAPVTVAVP